MPVHGEIGTCGPTRRWRIYRRRVERVVVAEDGLVVDLVDGRGTVVGKVECG